MRSCEKRHRILQTFYRCFCFVLFMNILFSFAMKVMFCLVQSINGVYNTGKGPINTTKAYGRLANEIGGECRGKVPISRWINIMKVFLQGDSYAPVGFCLTGGPIFLEETNQYKMGEAGQRKHSLFLDDLKPLSRKPSGTRDRKENYCKSKHGHWSMLWWKEIWRNSVQSWKDDCLPVHTQETCTPPCALDPEHKEVYKFLGCEQGDKTNTKRVIENSKNEVKKRTEQLAKRKLTNLIPT